MAHNDDKDLIEAKAAFNRMFLDNTMIGVVTLMLVGFLGLFLFELPAQMDRAIHLGIACANAFVIYRSWKYLRVHSGRPRG